MYEYKVDIYKLKYAAEAMNAYAKEGWRVIAVSPDKQDGFVDVFFERVPVVEEKIDKAAEELEAAVDMIDTVPDEIPENDIPAAPEAVPEETPDSVPAAVPEAVHDEPAVIAEVPAAEPAAAVEVPEAPESTDKLALEVLPYALTVSKVNHIENIDPSNDFFFIARTDNEVSLVCETEKTPFSTAAREDGWKALRVKGVLDFSLTGILSKIAGILAENGIAIFAVSTYDTDYILVKDDKLDKALNVLGEGGYDICR